MMTEAARKGAFGGFAVAIAIAAIGCSDPRPPADTRAPAAAPDTEIEAFLQKYFATWSAHDIEAYGRCFDVDATIQFLEPGGKLKVHGLRGFLEGQRRAQAGQPEMREAPTAMRIEREGDVATAFVRWRLESGERVVTGTDCFLLARRDGEWLVTALLVKSDPQ
ncbi:MAG: YybH family protein [Planctomycetota bacterium]|jgi:hypothetical protein